MSSTWVNRPLDHEALARSGNEDLDEREVKLRQYKLLRLNHAPSKANPGDLCTSSGFHSFLARC